MFKFLEATKKPKDIEDKIENIVDELRNIDFIFSQCDKSDCHYLDRDCIKCLLNKKDIYDAIISGLKNIDTLKEQNQRIKQKLERTEAEKVILYNRITNLNKALALWEATKIKNV